MIRLIENANEAFKATQNLVSVQLKIQYINQLMETGYFAVNAGRYDWNAVSQFSDLQEILVEVKKKNTKIIVSTENREEFYQAAKNNQVDYIEVPFSIVKELGHTVSNEKMLCRFSLDFSKKEEINNFLDSSLLEYCSKHAINKVIFTNSNLNPDLSLLTMLVEKCRDKYPSLKIGIRFYIEEKQYKLFFDTVLFSQCSFLESSIKGWGRNETGTIIPTEKVVTYLAEKKQNIKIDTLMMESAYNTAKKIFSEY